MDMCPRLIAAVEGDDGSDGGLDLGVGREPRGRCLYICLLLLHPLGWFIRYAPFLLRYFFPLVLFLLLLAVRHANPTQPYPRNLEPNLRASLGPPVLHGAEPSTGMDRGSRHFLPPFGKQSGCGDSVSV
uniref:Predicted protein n=1 Tax=Hordeum vulgare subsp. vulgare TaxID=112509 RepID=F2D831_HORVV|nr:predicted protein [Hordeum vulgare subsp. vulgare]